MKIKKDVKKISKSVCILFRVEKEEEEEHKNKERESDKTDQLNEFKRRENSHH